MKISQLQLHDLTGGRFGWSIWKLLSNLKNNLTAGGKTYHPVSLWPVYRISNTWFWSGGEKFLHQMWTKSPFRYHIWKIQCNNLKIALFSTAQLRMETMEIWRKLRKCNDIAFNFVETGKLLTWWNICCLPWTWSNLRINKTWMVVCEIRRSLSLHRN